MKTLVENLFALSTHLLRKDLAKTRRKEPVEGFLNVVLDNNATVVDYAVEYEGEETYLVVIFGVEPQRILLQDHQLTFGIRTYLTCSCGNRTTALYLHKGVFACRKCHELSYTSTTINKTSKHGRFIYQQNQILRIMNMREDMSRIFYGSKYTRRFVRWLELCGRAGLTKEVEDAHELMEAINS